MFPFNIMAKPVGGACNLDCAYCYYKCKPRELYADVSAPRMTETALESFTRQYLQAMPFQCDFNWQGGEPALAGLEFFGLAVELQRQYSRPGQVVTNNFQTNGVLMDDAWCEFLAANRFLVGVSIDGPESVHDANRRGKGGQGSFARAWAGLERLRRRGAEVNVLATLNAANVGPGAELYKFFVDRGLTYLQFIPVLERYADGAVTEQSITGEQWGRFMLELFEQWLAHDVGCVSERYIDHVLHVLVRGSAAMCCFAPRCANAFVLEHNGDLFACDHFVFREWRVGNILQTPLAELLQSPLLSGFAELKTSLPDACRDCEFLAYCNGGCPKHHTRSMGILPMSPTGVSPVVSAGELQERDAPATHGRDAHATAMRANHFCEGYKMFLSRALGDLKNIARDIAAKEAAASAPPPKAKLQPTSKKVPAPGRNAPCPCGSGRKFKQCCGR